MKHKFTNIFFVFIIGVLAVGFFWYKANRAGPQKEPDILVTTDADGFSPREVLIKKGETVRWINTDSSPHWPASDMHPSHEQYPEFDPREPVEPGEKWGFTFIKPGAWTYHDHLRPNKTGLVKVE